ncbi:hypothetical protein [Paenibacillus daejeonensis]|uniref:hypothetical protein n=1 Tax=Paenibacillus daejeonensis TaxID=135193 RepID=UPI00036A7B1C|nr:hypothetical protein [Paenibacillus daejeonensis]
MAAGRNKASKAIVLIVLHLFLSVGAVIGGLGMLISPSGQLIGLSLELLAHSPFSNYLLPGLLLTLVLGVMPLLVAVGLIRRTPSRIAERFNLYRDMHWAWTFSLYTGYALVIWIAAQVYFLQAVHAVHLLYWTLGFAIQILTLLPRTRSRYARSSS